MYRVYMGDDNPMGIDPGSYKYAISGWKAPCCKDFVRDHEIGLIVVLDVQHSPDGDCRCWACRNVQVLLPADHEAALEVRHSSHGDGRCRARPMFKFWYDRIVKHCWTCILSLHRPKDFGYN